MSVVFKAGDEVGGYKIIEPIGEGGLGQLFKATAPDGKIVKLKFPAASLIGDPATYERFLREFSIGQKLKHPGIQKTLSMGKSPEGIFLVSNYFEGVSLRNYIYNHAPLPIIEAIKITTQLVETVGYLHRKGVFHRDLKPENIVIDAEKQICIVDFGTALLEGAKRVTWRFGSNAFGTPDYMAPEQIQGKRGDARTDIYALGVIFYELLTGTVPFSGDNPLAAMNQHMTASPKSPGELNPEIPSGIEAIILKAIRRDPEERYQSAEDMQHDLENYNALDLSHFASDLEKPNRGAPLTDRQIWTISGIIAAAFLAIVVLIVVIVFLVKHH